MQEIAEEIPELKPEPPVAEEVKPVIKPKTKCRQEAALNKAKKQYQDKIEGLRRMLPEEWTVMSVYIMTGMASVNKEAWSVIRVGR